MKTVKVRALKQHSYPPDTPRKDGEIYDAPVDRLEAIVSFGWVKLLDPPLETKVEEAEESSKGKYERRDMRARK